MFSRTAPLAFVPESCRVIVELQAHARLVLCRRVIELTANACGTVSHASASVSVLASRAISAPPSLQCLTPAIWRLYHSHMATTSTEKNTSTAGTVELVTLADSLKSVDESQRQWIQLLNRRLSRKNVWVIDKTGDSFGHYVSLIGNLIGRVTVTEEPVFSLLRSTIKAGLPRSAFERVKVAIDTSAKELSEVTEISARTVSRRERFKPDESDRIFRVASAFQKAVEVFEDLEAARRWFSTPKRALGGLRPIECCDTDTGASEVEDLLSRISDGVFT